MSPNLSKKVTSKPSRKSDNRKRRNEQHMNRIPSEFSEKCLVTRDLATESPVHLCHVFHERYWSNHPLLSRFEWAWGKKYDTIQMDTDSNTISLRHDWRDLFESGRWALMPSMDMIDKLWDRWDRFPTYEGNVPPIEDMYDGAEIFEYRLVPLFCGVPPFSNRNKAEDSYESRNDQTAGSFVYSYLFDTLPPIFSAVKPHFVVCDAGRKLESMFPDWDTTTSIMARICGISHEKADCANMVLFETYRTWNDHVHPATFVTSPRTNYSRSRSGLIGPRQPTSAPQHASRPKKRVRMTGEFVNAACPQSNIVRYATSLSHVSACGPNVLIVGDSGWNTEVDAEFEKTQLRRVIKASKRWVRDCEREAHSSGGWVSCATDDEQMTGYCQEPARRMIATM